MTNAKNTSIRMTKQTKQKIKELVEAGHSSTITGIIELAVDRMYQDELAKGRVKPVRSGGWQVT